MSSVVGIYMSGVLAMGRWPDWSCPLICETSTKTSEVPVEGKRLPRFGQYNLYKIGMKVL